MLVLENVLIANDNLDFKNVKLIEKSFLQFICNEKFSFETNFLSNIFQQLVLFSDGDLDLLVNNFQTIFNMYTTSFNELVSKIPANEKTEETEHIIKLFDELMTIQKSFNIKNELEILIATLQFLPEEIKKDLVNFLQNVHLLENQSDEWKNATIILYLVRFLIQWSIQFGSTMTIFLILLFWIYTNNGNFNCDNYGISEFITTYGIWSMKNLYLNFSNNPILNSFVESNKKPWPKNDNIIHNNKLNFVMFLKLAIETPNYFPYPKFFEQVLCKLNTTEPIGQLLKKYPQLIEKITTSTNPIGYFATCVAMYSKIDPQTWNPNLFMWMVLMFRFQIPIDGAKRLLDEFKKLTQINGIVSGNTLMDSIYEFQKILSQYKPNIKSLLGAKGVKVRTKNSKK